jgi:glutamate racemase
MMRFMDIQPIGVIDSGLGGLTILKEIMAALPDESTIYIGDSKHAPYGARSVDDIETLSRNMITFLLQQNVKLIVIACNTITVTAIETLRNEFPNIPIVGTVPIIKKAAEVSHNKRIGVLSTTQTAQSDYQKNLIQKFAADCTVFNYGTDSLVPLIEAGKLDLPELESVLHKVLNRFTSENIDTLALGCTHFPIIKNAIQTILGPDVTLLDSGAAIARQVRRILEHNAILNSNSEAIHAFYTTGSVDRMEQMITSLSQQKLKVRGVTL